MENFYLNEAERKKIPTRSSVSTTMINSVPSPFNDERMLSTFLADYHRLYQTTGDMFLPAGEWFRQKGYGLDELIITNQRMSIQIDFELDTEQINQYITRFSAIQSGKLIEILTVEYDPVTKAIVLTGLGG